MEKYNKMVARVISYSIEKLGLGHNYTEKIINGFYSFENIKEFKNSFTNEQINRMIDNYKIIIDEIAENEMK